MLCGTAGGSVLQSGDALARAAVRYRNVPRPNERLQGAVRK